MEAPRDMGKKKKKYLSRIAQKFSETPSYFCAILEETFSPAFIMLPWSCPEYCSCLWLWGVVTICCWYFCLTWRLNQNSRRLDYRLDWLEGRLSHRLDHRQLEDGRLGYRWLVDWTMGEWTDDWTGDWTAGDWTDWTEVGGKVAAWANKPGAWAGNRSANLIREWASAWKAWSGDGWGGN